jgi:hypothetical protein
MSRSCSSLPIALPLKFSYPGQAKHHNSCFCHFMFMQLSGGGGCVAQVCGGCTKLLKIKNKITRGGRHKG